MVTDSAQRHLTSGPHPDTGRSRSTAVLDRDGVVVAVNEAWQAFCRDNAGDLTGCGPGANYLEVCTAAGDDPVARHAASMVRKALRGDLQAPATLLTPCAAPGTSGWFDMEVASRQAPDGTCDGASSASPSGWTSAPPGRATSCPGRPPSRPRRPRRPARPGRAPLSPALVSC
ncbi:PAS domain-containing protein [Nocardioides ungokensis]|uniref:PAS domain-containing protein n=1 Tax=Nocardioides ungokensis TaxID=1643322 RepID=UPI001FEADAD1|nr:PAS domain-containing protein [Nocardioides ungokensis]